MEKMAKKMTDRICKSSGLPVFSGGTMADTASRFGRLGMLRDTRPPALLVEAGFVSNRTDMATDPVKIAKGLADFFNNDI
jgi:N-acetylmuramoyl-L-alanine amidase